MQSVAPLHPKSAPHSKEEAIDAVPHSIEAEQQLLGAILSNNGLFDEVASIIKAEHFYEPVHGRIFDMCGARIAKNNLASDVTIKAFMENDEGLQSLGGGTYLAKLAASSVSRFAAKDYAMMIYDLAMRRSLIHIGRDIEDHAKRVDIESDARTQIVEAEQRLYSLAESGKASSGFESFASALTTAVTSANNARQREGALSGISTGLEDVNRKLGGLHPSDLLILAGRPSMGKTSLATNIAYNIASKYRQSLNPDGSRKIEEGGIVGFFSLEMSAEQLAARILSEAAEVPSENIRRGNLTDEEFRKFIDAAAALEACPLYIDDTPALQIAQIANRARRLQRTHGLDLLIIDYLQLVRANKSRDSRVNEVSEITQGLKAIAKELNIPVIALSQLSRAVETREDKRPQLSDLRESGSIEQDADVVMFVFREEYYRERENPGDSNLEKLGQWQQTMANVHGKAELIIGKQRHGPIGTVLLSYDGRFTKFSNAARKWQEEALDYQ